MDSIWQCFLAYLQKYWEKVGTYTFIFFYWGRSGLIEWQDFSVVGQRAWAELEGSCDLSCPNKIYMFSLWVGPCWASCLEGFPPLFTWYYITEDTLHYKWLTQGFGLSLTLPGCQETASILTSQHISWKMNPNLATLPKQGEKQASVVFSPSLISFLQLLYGLASLRLSPRLATIQKSCYIGSS